MKHWNIKKIYDAGDDVLKLLLENRTITSPDDLENFLHPPKISVWLDKFSQEFKDSLKTARHIIEGEMKTGRPIIVHGDYDADGVSATAILYQTLKEDLGYENTHYFIPNRFNHGYGLSQKSLQELTERFGTGLLITVDSGITAINEVAQAKNNGFKVIITDHHQKPEILPDADCIVWSDKVVGSTLSWILSRVLGSQNPYSISLAALATVTDLSPVLGINRTILKIGLEILNSNPPMGLKKMFELAGRSGKRITSYDLGWVVGPRLNASGRLIEAEDSLRLLIAKNEDVALDLAQKLNTVNITRQDKTLEMFELASDFDQAYLPKIIFSAKEDYHEGIIGLVAAKLAQKHYRPAIVVSIFDGHGKGSVRSVAGVNIIELLREIEYLFDSLGGHPMAAGFSMKAEKLPELEKHLIELGEKYIKDEHLIRTLNVDLKIPIETADIGLIHKLEDLEPFGIGNEEPVFCSDNVDIAAVDKVGREDQHLTLKLYKDGKTYKAIWFGAGEHAGNYKAGDTINIAYTLSKNEYNGKVSVDLVIKDVQKN